MPAMPFIPVPNVALAEVRCLLDGQRIENTLYFEHATDPDASELGVLADVVRDWYVASVLPQLSNKLYLREVYMTSLTTATSPTYTLAVVPQQPGGQTPDSLPGGSCLCVSLRTAGRGRASRGRNYISGLAENSVQIGRVDLAYADSLQAAYAALLGVLPINWNWVVVSKQVDGVKRATGFPQPVQSVIVVDNYIDSQRRRNPGRGT